MRARQIVADRRDGAIEHHSGYRAGASPFRRRPDSAVVAREARRTKSLRHVVVQGANRERGAGDGGSSLPVLDLFCSLRRA